MLPPHPHLWLWAKVIGIKIFVWVIHGYIIYKALTFTLALADILTGGDGSRLRGWFVSLGIANPFTIGSIVIAVWWTKSLHRRYRLATPIAMMPAACLAVLIVVPGLIDLHWLWISYLALAVFWGSWLSEQFYALWRWTKSKWHELRAWTTSTLCRPRPS